MSHRQSEQHLIESLVNLYLQKLEQNPVLTKAITSGAIAGLGDVTSQVILQVGNSGDRHYSWRSTVAFASFSMVITGPVTHYIYQFLENVVPKKSQFSSVKKAILDRLLFAPPYLLALFYFVSIMEVQVTQVRSVNLFTCPLHIGVGKSHSDAWKNVKLVYWPALLKNFVVWGAAQYINMRYVPVKYRVLYGNMVALFWNIYLALIRR